MFLDTDGLQRTLSSQSPTGSHWPPTLWLVLGLSNTQVSFLTESILNILWSSSLFFFFISLILLECGFELSFKGSYTE